MCQAPLHAAVNTPGSPPAHKPHSLDQAFSPSVEEKRGAEGATWGAAVGIETSSAVQSWVILSCTLLQAAGDLDRYKTERCHAAGSCDATLDGAEGWILSPNYPSDYANFGTCTFTVRKLASDVCTLRLTLDDFDLEDSTDCFNDYLLLPDGQKLCGALPPDTSKTVSISRRHSSFTFIFSSNEAKTARGFMIRVEQVRDSCSDDLPDSPLFPTDSQTDDFLPVGRPQPQFAGGGACDRDVLGYSHVLSSPGYPYGYPPNQHCLYRVWRADRSVCLVELDVQDFELNQRDCFRDYLDLPDGTQFCGQVSGTKLLQFAPGSENLLLKFVSDSYGSGKGFNILLHQRPNSCRGPVHLGAWCFFPLRGWDKGSQRDAVCPQTLVEVVGPPQWDTALWLGLFAPPSNQGRSLRADHDSLRSFARGTLIENPQNRVKAGCRDGT
ncbi:hypothetical protein HPB48_003782 [Haemaphysalis longicornis]|uniref:CUB domain-containing protein n=1 Tax=Haemaphysalis longicornis TaxID=44386 RepID=A0A9J6FHH2_HAELO|nr:hypothetical protein HPB48_003782 [Haemaphysalis longicornis]